jgi:hypothetical protein
VGYWALYGEFGNILRVTDSNSLCLPSIKRLFFTEDGRPTVKALQLFRHSEVPGALREACDDCCRFMKSGIEMGVSLGQERLNPAVLSPARTDHRCFQG